MSRSAATGHGHGPVYDAATWLLEHGFEVSAAASDPAVLAWLATAAVGTVGIGAAGVRGGAAAYYGAKAAVFGGAPDLLVGYRAGTPLERLARSPVHLSWEDRLMHAQVVGPTGSAKTSLLESWAVRDLAAGRKVFILEIFGDLASRLVPYARAMRAPVSACDASDPKSLRWNILSGHEEEAGERLASAIRSMSGHEYWAPVSANLAADLVRLAKRYASHRGRDADAALVELLASEPRFFRHAVGARRVEGGGWAATAPFLDRRTRWWAEGVLSWSPETRHKNTSGVSNRMRELLATEAARETLCPGPGDTILDLARALGGPPDGAPGGLVVLRFPAGLFGSRAARLAAALAFRELQSLTLSRPQTGAPPLAPYLDEFPTLVGREEGAAEEAADWLALVRKSNAAVTVAFQGRALLDRALAGALATNARNVFVAGGLEPDDLEWAQKMMGSVTRTVEDVRTQTGGGGVRVTRSRRQEEGFRFSREEVRAVRRGRWLASLVRGGSVRPALQLSAVRPPSTRAFRRAADRRAASLARQAARAKKAGPRAKGARRRSSRNPGMGR